MSEFFRKFAARAAAVIGSPAGFFTAFTVVLLWLLTGPLFGFSTNWQLFINTTTTIITFLVVFLIQNTQNRDARAAHIKLDELVKSVKGARNRLVNIEDVSDKELEELHQEFQAIHENYEKELERRKQKIAKKE